MATLTTTKKKSEHKDLTVLHAQKSGPTSTNKVQATQWYPMYTDWGKTSRRSAADMGYRHTSREVPPSSNCWSGLRIRTPRTAKVMSFTITNVMRCTAMKNTYGKLPEPWGKGTKNI